MKQRTRGFGQLLILFFFSVLIFPNAARASVNQPEIIKLTNIERSNLGLPALVENATLNQAAELKAADMAALGYFSHNSPEGRTPWSFIDESGYKYSSAGENLAVDFSDNEAIMRAWMNSPGHRANIVNSNYKEIGVAFRQGVYQGRNTIFVVQMFGVPASDTYPVKKEAVIEREVVPVVANELETPIQDDQNSKLSEIEVVPIVIDNEKGKSLSNNIPESVILAPTEQQLPEISNEEIAGVELKKDEMIPQVLSKNEKISFDGEEKEFSKTDDLEEEEGFIAELNEKLTSFLNRISVWWNSLIV